MFRDIVVVESICVVSAGINMARDIVVLEWNRKLAESGCCLSKVTFLWISLVSAQTDGMYFFGTIRDAPKFDFTPLAMCLSLPSGARFDRGRVR